MRRHFTPLAGGLAAEHSFLRLAIGGQNDGQFGASFGPASASSSPTCRDLPRTLSPFTISAALATNGSRKAKARSGGRGCRVARRQCRATSASRARLQSRQLPAHAGSAGTDQGLVADEREGEVDQDRAKVVRHGRQVAFQIAELAAPRMLFAEILRLTAELRPPPDPALA